VWDAANSVPSHILPWGGGGGHALGAEGGEESGCGDLGGLVSRIQKTGNSQRLELYLEVLPDGGKVERFSKFVPPGGGGVTLRVLRFLGANAGAGTLRRGCAGIINL
jgi:hypothetical protein